MNRRTLGGVVLVLGVVLVVVGVLLMAVIVPGMKQFPDDVDTTREYQGQMAVLFSTATFEFMNDFPFDLKRHFETEETDGDKALVYEEQVMISPTGETLLTLIKHHAIDRKTMEGVEDYPESWAATEGFFPRQGLILGWPIDTEKKDYDGWNDDYGATVVLKYEGEQEHPIAKMNTYYFTSSSGPQPIVPEAVLRMGLPAEIAKEQLIALASASDLNALVKAALPGLLEGVEGDMVPLAYYYEYEGEYWVEPETGVLIDTKKHELRKVGLPEELLAANPLMANMSEEQRAATRIPVLDFTYQGKDASVLEAKDDAEEAKDMIQLYGMTLPLAAIVLGALLALVGLVLATRKSAT